MAYLVFGKLLYHLWHFFATGQIAVVVNGQRLNNNGIAIRSHAYPLSFEDVSQFE